MGVLDVLGGGIGHPQQVVGEAGSNPPAGAIRERVPPVQYVAFDELVGGVEQDLIAGDPRVVADQVERVLQLVAEAECAAGLVVGCARPDTAHQGLIRQPVVDQDVHVRLAGVYAGLSGEVFPEALDLRQRLVYRAGLAQLLEQARQARGVVGLAQHEAEGALITRFKRDDGLQRGAVQPLAGTSIQRGGGFHRQRARRTTTLADDAGAVAAVVQGLCG